MKKRYSGILTVITAGILFFSSCTANEPFHLVVDNADSPIDVVVVDSDGDIVEFVFEVDPVTGALVVLDYEHNEIHAGDMFTVLEVIDLENGQVWDVLIRAPDTTRWAHLVWEIEHELETTIEFYQGATYSDNGTGAGTPLPSFNRNGNSDTEATTLVSHTANITGDGALVGTIQQGSGKKAGGSDRESNEFILEQGSNYLIRITNMTANDNLVFMKLNWYELINKG